MKALPTTLAFAILLSTSAPAQEKSPKWLLVRSNARALVSFIWDKLAKVYLKKDYRIVLAGAANKFSAASRFVVGTPSANALVKKLAEKLGISYKGKSVVYRGKQYPADSGLAIVTDDPDGKGTLVLFTGATPQGVYSCLSVSVDLARHGFVAMTWQKALLRGKVMANTPLRVDGTALRVVRLDVDLWSIRDSIGKSSLDEAALRVSRVFAGYKFVFERAVAPDIDLLAFTRRQFRQQKMDLDATQQRFAKVDIVGLLRQEEENVAKALGGRRGPRPVVYTIVTEPGGTNAKAIGPDPQTGRVRVILNLAAFSSVEALRLSAAHEFVHTLQTARGNTLLTRAMHEGVAVFVSQQLCPGTTDHEALMWSEDKLSAARKNRKAIFTEFRRLKDLRDMGRIGAFLYAGKALRAVRGAPDRCGYWVGWMAVAAWRSKHPKRPLADLLTVDPAKIFAALQN